MICKHAQAAAATSARAWTAPRNRRTETRQVGSDPLLLREGNSRNGWQPTADALLALQTATGRSRRQRSWLDRAVFAGERFATGCHRLQPRGSIKAPFFVVRQGDSGSGGEGAAHT